MGTYTVGERFRRVIDSATTAGVRLALPREAFSLAALGLLRLFATSIWSRPACLPACLPVCLPPVCMPRLVAAVCRRRRRRLFHDSLVVFVFSFVDDDEPVREGWSGVRSPHALPCLSGLRCLPACLSGGVRVCVLGFAFVRCETCVRP